MTVKRVGAKRKTRKRAGKPPPGGAGLSLPTKMSKANPDVRRYVTLLYGRAGVGKTTLAASYPGAVFLPTEPGTKGLDTYEIPEDGTGIRNWDQVRAAVDVLEADGAKTFQTVVIDTVDRAYEMAMAWTCEQLGIEHVSEDASGKRDRSGKGWTELKKEFTTQLYRLIEAGYGLVLTSHSKVASIESSTGLEYDVIQPSMSGQALGVIKSITDCIFYAEFVKSAGDGRTKRILVTEGDELILAKARGPWPKFLPLPRDGGYELIRDAFAGKDVGLDPGDIIVSKQTDDPAAKSVALEKRKGEAKEEGRGTASRKGAKRMSKKAVNTKKKER